MISLRQNDEMNRFLFLSRITSLDFIKICNLLVQEW